MRIYIQIYFLNSTFDIKIWDLFHILAVGNWQHNRSWFTALIQSGCTKCKECFSLLSVKHSMYLNKKQEQNGAALKMHELTARIGEGNTERERGGRGSIAVQSCCTEKGWEFVWRHIISITTRAAINKLSSVLPPLLSFTSARQNYWFGHMRHKQPAASLTSKRNHLPIKGLCWPINIKTIYFVVLVVLVVPKRVRVISYNIKKV